MSKIRVRVWRDEYRRVIPTGDGPMVCEPGETCIVVCGRDLDAGAVEALRALGGDSKSKLVLVEETE